MASREPDDPAAEAGTDPVARAILDLLAERGPAKSISPEDAARAFAASRSRPVGSPEQWHHYLLAVRQQALHLARRGQIRILRKGKAVDPGQPVKGVIRLALPEGGGAETA